VKKDREDQLDGECEKRRVTKSQGGEKYLIYSKKKEG
jgi:hypothetical protein